MKKQPTFEQYVAKIAEANRAYFCKSHWREIEKRYRLLEQRSADTRVLITSLRHLIVDAEDMILRLQKITGEDNDR
jgi:hypothetical protein